MFPFESPTSITTNTPVSIPNRSPVTQEVNKNCVPSTDSDVSNCFLEQPVDKTYTCSLDSSQSRKVLLKVIPVVVRGPQGDVDTFALLDDGSSATLIDSSLTTRLGIRGPDGYISIQGVSGMSCKEHVQHVSFQIRGKFRDDFHVINNARSMPKLALSKQTVSIQDVNHSHLKDISSELTYDDTQPTILIGAEDWPLTLPQKVKSGSCKQPIAALTALDGLFTGPLIIN
jgi:hypothetical protein